MACDSRRWRVQQAAVKAEEQGRLQRGVTRKQVPSHTAGKEMLVTGDKTQEQHGPQKKILPAPPPKKRKKILKGKSLKEKEHVLKSIKEVL